MSTTSGFMDLNTDNKRHVRAGDASDFTRYLRMKATAAPYIAQNASMRPNLLGWRDMQANRDAKVIPPIFGTFLKFNPNSG